jgi:tetratricopeptide (TPR) repeat protein
MANNNLAKFRRNPMPREKFFRLLPVCLVGLLVLATPGLSQKSPGTSLLSQGDKLFREFKLSEAEAKFREALQASEAAKNKAGMGQALERLGKLAYDLGHYAQAIELYHQAAKFYGELHQKAGESTVLGEIGRAYDAWGDLPGAIHYYKEALKGPLKPEQRASWAWSLGQAYVHLGDVDESVRYFRMAQAAARELSPPQLAGDLLLKVGDGLQQARHLPEAKAAFQQALAIKGDAGLSAKALSHLGDLSLAQGNLGEAESFYSQAKDRLGMGRLALVQKHYDQALAAFRQVAPATAREDQDEISFATQAGLGLALLGQNQYPQAETHLRKAVETLERLREILPIGARVYFLSGSIRGFNSLAVYEALVLSLNMQGKQAEAFKIAEFTRSRVLTESLMSKLELPGQTAAAKPAGPPSREVKAATPSHREAKEVTIEIMPLGKISRFLQNPTSFYDSAVSALIIAAVMGDFGQGAKAADQGEGGSRAGLRANARGALLDKIKQLKQKGLSNHLTSFVN